MRPMKKGDLVKKDQTPQPRKNQSSYRDKKSLSRKNDEVSIDQDFLINGNINDYGGENGQYAVGDLTEKNLNTYMSNNDMTRAADDMNLPLNTRPFSGSVQKIKKKRI